MPVTPEAIERLMAPMLAVRSITSKKMFGGIGIYSDGIFFAVIDDDRLYFKSDAQSDPAFDEYESAPWVLSGDPPSAMPYRELPTVILADPIQLAEWIDAAVAVAERKKTKPKSPRKKA